MIIAIQFPSDLTSKVTAKYNELVRILEFRAHGVAVDGTVHMDVWGVEAPDFVEILQEEISEDEIRIIEL